MPIQDLIAEHAPSFLQAVFRSTVAFVRFLFVHILFNLVLFNLGRAGLLIVTLGRYPRGRNLVAHENRIAACGVVIVALVWCGIALFNHFAAGGGA